MSNAPFMKHFRKLLDKYKHVTVINLLSKTKPKEIPLCDTFEWLLNQNNGVLENRSFYQHFDFHEICKRQKFQNVS